MEYSFVTSLIDIAVIYAIVIVVSLLVAVVIRIIVATLSRQAERAAAAAAAELQTRAVAPAPTTGGIPTHHLQAIAAAVAAMTGAYRVVRIEPKGPSYGWTATARTLHHGSHQPRRR